MSALNTAAPAWQRLGTVPPRELVATRLQVHHAAQIIVSAAISWIPARPDDSHTSLTWSDELGALLTEPLNAAGARFGLQCATFELIWTPDGITIASSFSLHGRSVAEASEWVRTRGADVGLDAAAFTTRKHYEIPRHSVSEGGVFDGRSHASFQELARYWHNATAILARLVAREPGASDVRCWPHHFDIATLITLPAASRTKTVGVGHEPGDEWYAEPYWYISPSPYPTDTSALPALAGGGRWHTKGWVGAVLPASDYVRDAADVQERTVGEFVASALTACQAL